MAAPRAWVGTVERGLDGPPGTRGAVVASEDDGQTWRSVLFPGAAESTVWSIAAHHDSDAVLAAAIGGELFASEDQGLAWRRLAPRLGETCAVHIH